MPSIPSVKNLLRYFPNAEINGDAVAVLVGGAVQRNFEDKSFEGYKDTCAIRVSRALNFGGDPIPTRGGGVANPYIKAGKVRTDRGGDGYSYIFSVYDLRAYLSTRYGQPRRYKKTVTQHDLAAENTAGIIIFAFWHADIWDGSTCAYHNRGFGESKVQEIVVFPAPA
jgi:hypothetical protein